MAPPPPRQGGETTTSRPDICLMSQLEEKLRDGQDADRYCKERIKKNRIIEFVVCVCVCMCVCVCVCGGTR